MESLKITKAIYPGTFDPVTNGHIDLIRRACSLFDEVVVAVADSKDKKPLFNAQARLEMARLATAEFPKVRVELFDTLLVDFARTSQIPVIIRGLRAVSDFEYELQIAYANRSLWDRIETICLMPSLENAFISSTVVRSVLKHNGCVRHLVPAAILDRLTQERACMS